MKKLMSLALALLMAASLAGCGSSAPAQSSSSAGAATSSAAIASASAANPMAGFDPQKAEVASGQSDTAALPTFGVSYTGLLDVLKESHTGFDAEPETHVMQTTDGVSLNQYIYTADDFISVQFYETETNELQSVIVMAKYADMTSDQAKTLGSFFALITGAFEPDASTLNDIDKKLDIANAGFASGTCNLASGTLADYMYIVDNSSAMVTITAI
ncbi:hypothetical protein [Oscillibacter ruminantium]|uniref:hypothetical protein n=1 Tax=Oscillibacter ruminantium TaxID=1263547 RepID=UPI0002D96C82|nr:hypothetical protein [Oscillibacter ruminantium]